MKVFFLTALVVCSINALGQQVYYDVTEGNGNGIRFWQHDYYKIHMGTGAEYQYGPVTDYSIKVNMSNHPGRGWTWGVGGLTPIAALNTIGDMQIAGSFIANKIGIGTSSPAGGLDINAGGNYAIRTLTSSRYVIEVRNTNDTDGGWWLVNDPNGNFAIHENSVGDKFTINPDGKVGIGTTTPWANLEVIGPTTGYGPAIFASGGGDLLLNAQGALFFDGNYSYNTGNYIRPLAPNTQSFATAGIERLRINPDGNIGIGTSSPGGKLEINHAGGQLKLAGGAVAAGLWTNSADLLYLANWNVATKGLIINLTSGNVGIGTASPNEKLTVDGTIYGKEVKVDLSVPGPDYVFDDNYKLRPLEELHDYIASNGHLPEVPSADEMADDGIRLGDMNMTLLKKVEELTLYIIEMKSENTELKKENAQLRADLLEKLKKLEARISGSR